MQVSPQDHHLSQLQRQQRKLREAKRLLSQALAQDPSQPRYHHDFAMVLSELGEHDQAILGMREALRLKPDDYPSAINLGVLLEKRERYAEAEEAFKRAAKLKPDAPEPLSGLVNVQRSQAKILQALESARRYVKLSPRWSDALTKLAMCLQDVGQMEEATATFRRVLALTPSDATAQLNLALALLHSGQWEEGWAKYECRFRLPTFKGDLPELGTKPPWDGSDPRGKTVLIVTEQGLGTIIQFSRYVSVLAQQGANVILQVPQRLVPLLSFLPGVAKVIGRDQPLPDFDCHAAVVSLPHLCKTTLSNVPCGIPYLVAQTHRIERWRQELEHLKGLRVGIAWQGNPAFGGDRFRSLPLAAFEPLSRVQGVHLLSLQQNKGHEQLEQLGRHLPPSRQFHPLDLGSHLDKEGAFIDTAAVMMNLDVVVTSDTSMAHVAGALGVPVWVSLAQAPDWRWLQGRDDCPWYPTMRLFHQTKLGVWQDVFERIAEELRGLLQKKDARTSRASVNLNISAGELIDRLTILQIKDERIQDPQKLIKVRVELGVLQDHRRDLGSLEGLEEVERQIKAVNEQLWLVEDDLRACERAGDFGEIFKELARSVYRLNDRRHALRCQIDTLAGSPIREVKSYAPYDAAHAQGLEPAGEPATRIVH